MATSHFKTYLELVNEVLARLRERQVTTVTQSPYSRMIGSFVNKVKYDVEQAHRWQTLRESWQVNTAPEVTSYYMDVAGPRAQFIACYNVTTGEEVKKSTNEEMDRLLVLDEPNRSGPPKLYIPNAHWDSQDVKVDIWPVPDASYLLQWNIYAPQGDLVADTDTMGVPYRPVIEGALAMAYAERGEDGGQMSLVQWQVYNSALSDAIAVDAGLNDEEMVWEPK